MEPGRELRLAAELADPDDELRERVLRRVARVLGVAQQVQREPLDPRGVPLAERRERLLVAGLGARHENRVGEPLVDERNVGAGIAADWTTLRAGAVARRAYSSGRGPGARSSSCPACAGAFGRTYLYAIETPSTQTMPPPDAPHGTVALAEHQTAGRGRLGRVWVDEPGSGPRALGRPPPAAAGRALARADARRRRGGRRRDRPRARRSRTRTTSSSTARKVAGILAEAGEHVVLGIGVNVGERPVARRRLRRARPPRAAGRHPRAARAGLRRLGCRTLVVAGKGLQPARARNTLRAAVKISLLLRCARRSRGGRSDRRVGARCLAHRACSRSTSRTDVNPVTQSWLNDQLDQALQGSLRRGGDRPRHARRRRGVDAEDRPEGAPAQRGRDAGDRLRLAERRARRVGRRLDLRRRPTCSRWRPRRTSAPRRRSRAPGRTSAATCGGRSSTTRRRRSAASRRPTAATPPGPNKAVKQAVEPDRRRGAEAERDRHDLAEPAGAPRTRSTAGRPSRRTSRCTPPAPTIDDTKPGLPDALPVDPHRPERRLAALPRRDRRDRVRDLPSRDRAARRARRDLDAARALRALRPAALVDRRRRW